MMVRLISVIAATALLAACASDNKDDMGSADMGSTQPAAAAPSAPSGPAMDSAEYFNQVVGNGVYYDLDEYSLNGAAQATLRGQASWLSQNPSRSIVVEGHCDERGTREYNLGLGERRANSAKDYLVSLGVAPSRVRTISYGKERPVCVASNESCWSRNRRGVSVVQ
jgi:peptidoglycan-associated lipoprotein